MNHDTWKQERLKLLIEKFRGYKVGMAFALDTTVYHNSKPLSDELEPFLELTSYDNTPVIWANPFPLEDKTIQVQQLYVPFQDDGLTALKIARRTLSLMCYMAHGIPIVEKYNAASPYPGIVMLGDKFRYMSLNGYNFETLFRAVDINKIDEQCWVALAYYRLGSNSTNEYYKFLSLRQTVEVSFDNDTRKMNDWFQAQSTDPQVTDWASKLPTSQKLSGRLDETRAICAHVANRNDGKPTRITDPDDVESVRQVQNDLPIMQLLAEKRMRSFLAI